MNMDLNTADKQRTFDPIPDGSFCKVLLQFKPGGFTLPGCAAMDNNLFKSSQRSDAVMLECEITVIQGPHEHRKFNEFWVVSGGNLDDKGNSKGFNITKTRMRAAIESNMGIRPDDESQQARAARQISGFSDLNNITFWAKIGVDPGEPYTDQQTGQQRVGFDKNKIDRIVTPDMAEYADLAAGKEVAPKPSGAKRISVQSAGGAPAPQARSWGDQPDAQPGLPLAAQGQPAITQPTQTAPTEHAKKPAWLNR